MIIFIAGFYGAFTPKDHNSKTSCSTRQSKINENKNNDNNIYIYIYNE